MKLLLYLLGGTVLTLVLFMGGCRLLNKQIFNQQSCERFNIDNIEVRTGIDIPTVENSSCECSRGVKDAEFTLKLKPENIDRYVSRNKFELKDSVYVNANEDEYTKWIANLDLKTQKLKVHIDYKK